MDEKELANRLNHDIQTLLAGHAPAGQAQEGEYRELLDIARHLARNDMSAQSRVRSTLKQALLNRLRDQDHREAENHHAPKGNRTMQPKLRAVSLALTALLVLIIGFAFTPAGQAFAQNVWQQVGPLLIVNRTAPSPEPTPLGATPTPLPGAAQPLPPLTGSAEDSPPAVDLDATPTPMPASQGVEPLDDQMALDRYGFATLQPQSLPAGYTLTEHQISRTQDGTLISHSVYTTGDARYLSIQQSTFDAEAPIEVMVGDATVRAVRLHGLSATWIEDAVQMTVTDASGNNASYPVDYLLWEEDGLFFRIDATHLSQAEILQVAESLR